MKKWLPSWSSLIRVHPPPTQKRKCNNRTKFEQCWLIGEQWTDLPLRRHLTKILQNSWGPSNYLNEKGLSRNVILQIKTSNAPHHHASEIRYAPHHHTSEIRYAPLASVFRCARVASELRNIQKLTSDIRYACDASEFRYATLTVWANPLIDRAHPRRLVKCMHACFSVMRNSISRDVIAWSWPWEWKN